MRRSGKRGAFRDKKIGVLMGGVSGEREISLKTGGSVVKALKACGYNAVAIDAGQNLCAKIKSRRIGACFIALHGSIGEDGCVQGALEVMGLPYTGSGVLASAMAMDKIAAKKFFIYHGIPTPRFTVAGKNGHISGRLKLPLVVKPASGGSTLGVTVVRKRAGLKRALKEAGKGGQKVMVEEFIAGRELTVAILYGEVLPVIEIIPRDGFYDFNAKYTKGMTEFMVPARLKKTVERKVSKAGLEAYGALGCSGAARVDIVLDGDENPFVLEVNTVPGLTETSLFPMAASAAGLDYKELVVRILTGADVGKH